VQPDGSVMTALRDLVTSSLTDYFAYPAIAPASLTRTDADIARLMAATAHTAAFTAATSTDLTTFAARGGKLMITDGWSDPIFSARDLVRWYERMGADMAAAGTTPADGFARLFMVPGMAHCSGGAALDDMDALGALVRWVEEGKAPASMVASGRAFPGVSRPICAWPALARYDGKGSLQDAASFRCER
jgi:feruloyl esterase